MRDESSAIQNQLEVLIPEMVKSRLAVVTYLFLDIPEIKKISLENALLIGLGVALESSKKDKVIYDEWYIQTFFLFPWRFTLSERFPIPDLEKMNKRWRGLRDKSYIKGSRKDGWKLTTLGKNNFVSLIKSFPNPTDLDKQNVSLIVSYMAEKEISSTQNIQSFIDRSKNIPNYVSWETRRVIDPSSLKDVLYLIDLPMGSGSNLVCQKLLELIEIGGELDRESSEIQNLREWLVFQAEYLENWLPSSSRKRFKKVREEL